MISPRGISHHGLTKDEAIQLSPTTAVLSMTVYLICVLLTNCNPSNCESNEMQKLLWYFNYLYYCEVEQTFDFFWCTIILNRQHIASKLFPLFKQIKGQGVLKFPRIGIYKFLPCLSHFGRSQLRFEYTCLHKYLHLRLTVRRARIGKVLWLYARGPGPLRWAVVRCVH